ncbi:MAG: DNA helicase RecQ [Ignavibacteriae bacterium]|nr:DNA helicase RecQ [Ignavibacteriota bacterium]
MNKVLSTLKQYFGYTSFHPLQEEIITDLLNDKDVFVLMPTGGGKSLCYQLPAIMREGVTVVISPLIALMKDQVDGLRKNGVRASFINSSMNDVEIESVRKELLAKNVQLLYVAPERMKLGTFLSFLKQLNVRLFAIDEAHCISEWGHDFRPDYRQLTVLRKEFPSVPVVALTATAVPAVREDILTHLHLRNPKTYVASFNRQNLFYQVQPKQQTYQQLLTYLNNHKNDSGIIYCFSRKGTESLAEKLKDDGYKVLPYHAGLDAVTRTKHQEMFINDDVNIIVATIAFGMGINKSNVRFVIHHDLPKNIEGYYQETGRAGRDGLPSDCILFFGYGDIVKIEYFLDQKPEVREREIAYAKLKELVRYAESRICRRKILLNYFGEKYSVPNCGNCDNCLNTRDMIDGTIIAQKIISCITRTGERFGMNYIVDVLLGNPTEKILQNRHGELKTFGVGKEYSKREWQRFIRELTSLKVIDVQEEPYPVLKLNDASMRVLKGEKVLLSDPHVEKHLVEKKEVTTSVDSELFESLRRLRKELAVRENVPPYLIFSDATLKELASKKPTDVSELSTITGMGQVKLRRYGNIFLKEVQRHVQPYDKSAIDKHDHDYFSTSPKGMDSHSDEYSKMGTKWTEVDEQILIREYSEGKSINDIALILQRKEGGIRSRLAKLGLIEDENYSQ